MASNKVVTTQVEALKAACPAGAEVSGLYDAEVRAYTWTVFVPTPTEDEPDLGQGVSRQYVLLQGSDTPDQAVLDGMVTEIASTLAAATAPQGDPA